VLTKNSLSNFRPRIVDSLKTYDLGLFWKDLGAGITVGLVALPLAIAFAIASGVKPEAGLISAIIGGLIISALGGSKVQIGGPAGAFVVVIYTILEHYGLANLIIATSLAGMLLFLMGLFKVGNLIKFIPIAIIYGFTSGIGLLICLSQIKEGLGLSIEKMPADFFSQIATLSHALSSANYKSIGLCISTILFLVIWPRLMSFISRKTLVTWITFIPSIVVILIVTTMFIKFSGMEVATIGSRFGGIPNTLPKFQLPDFNWESAKLLFIPTITITLLGAIESLLCARVADSMSDDRHNPNQELMAQGVANFLTPLFGGLAVTGTIARTATNARAGAQSPVAGIIHALTVLLVAMIAAPWAEFIPMPALAGILLYIGWNMIEWHEFKRLPQFNRTYQSIFLGTFFLTVIFDLTVAVEVGLVLSCIFFIYRISSITKIDPIELPSSTPHASEIEAYAIYGSLFFGSIHHIEKLFDPTSTSRTVPKMMILDMHQVITIDSSGLDALMQLHRNLSKKDASLIICDANAQTLSLMTRSGFLDEIGVANCCPDIESAYSRAQSLLTI
jgi:SulP family sulfate permease